MYEFGDFLFGDLQVVARKRMLLLNYLFLRKAEIGVSLFVEFALPPPNTNDYLPIINGCFR